MEAEIRKQGNLDVTLVGPEVTGDGNDWKTGRKQAAFNQSFLHYFLDGSNHVDGRVPEIASYHMGVLIHANSGESAMHNVEKMITDPNGIVQGIETMKRETGQQTKMTINEFMNFVVDDWCDPVAKLCH